MADLDKTIKAIEEWINDPNALDTEIDACLVADALELLKEQQPKKKGKWIDKQFLVCGCCGAKCSVCGGRSAGYSKETIGGNDYFFYPYCQNCGAEMDGEQKRSVRWSALECVGKDGEQE